MNTTVFSELLVNLPPELLEGPDAENIIKECFDVTKLLLTKNRAYGSSFRSPPNCFSKLGPVEAINVRMDDKVARMREAKDFSEDTEQDLIGYLILKRVLLRLEAAAKEPELPVQHIYPAPDKIFCYLCTDEVLRVNAVNFKGHFAHPTCITRWCRRNATSPSLPEPPPASPYPKPVG